MEFNRKLQIALGILRLEIGFIFLWVFFDKLLGLVKILEPNKISPKI
jgi:hypothetical protein